MGVIKLSLILLGSLFSVSYIAVGLTSGSVLALGLGILALFLLFLYLLSCAASLRIPTEVQSIVRERSGGKCDGCGKTRDLSFDRIDPRGGNKENNIRLLCQTCRTMKQSIIKLNDPNFPVRWEAVWTIRNLHDKQAVEPLRATFKNDPDPTVRKAAVIALAACGDTTVRDSLAELCKDKHVSIKKYAALELGRVGDTRARRYLNRLILHDNDLHIREQAHQLLLELDNVKSIRNSPNRNIPQHVKDEVWRRDGGICRICGSNIDLQYDHDVPLSRGGGNQVENIQLLCKTCNLAKGNKIM